MLDGSFSLPASSGGGANRENRRRAGELLGRAGYRLKAGRLVSAKTGRQLALEIIVASREQERLALSYSRALERAGIGAKVRYVDSAKYQRRLQTFDFDIIEYRWYASLSPGNEQRIFWGSEAAGQDGSRNYAGISDPAVDAMIDKLLEARQREEFVAAARALDRLLLAGNHVIPLFHLPRQWAARWDHIRRPEKGSLHGFVLDAWWHRDAGGGAAGAGEAGPAR